MTLRKFPPISQPPPPDPQAISMRLAERGGAGGGRKAIKERGRAHKLLYEHLTQLRKVQTKSMYLRLNEAPTKC